ncbi:CotD family spore coat protein [Bacillus sp. PS06]|uniref:CotD family spore coat protein n=1 Tax=Bacillus sp. PS06 TaxID=2764176 RepID=UPI0017831EE9|nr:CotD family spore coat protein [Bacillus sp. PS06]MBD8070095.1 spore coat protein CotD [Bacillus sp. PS06]
MSCFGPRPKALSPVVYPTRVNAVNSVQNIEVPHIHPSHTVFNRHTNFVHRHYYPHTTSVNNTVSNQHVQMGPTAAGPGFPGNVAGANAGPGFPGNVAGANAGPGFPGNVAGANAGFPGAGCHRKRFW